MGKKPKENKPKKINTKKYPSYIIDGVPTDILDHALNGWSDGTVGNDNERQAIQTLNELCKKHGYGRIPQLAKEIENIWRDPSRVEEYRKARMVREMMIEENRKQVEKSEKKQKSK